MRQKIATLLSDLVNTGGATASVYSLAGGNLAAPVATATAGILATLLRCWADGNGEQEVNAKLDALLRSEAMQNRESLDIARLAGLPTAAISSDESPGVILYLALERQIKDQSARLDEFHAWLERHLPSGDLVEQLAAVVIEESDGLRALLASQGAEAAQRHVETVGLIREISQQFVRHIDDRFDELWKSQHYPRLHLPLTARSEDDSAAKRLVYTRRRVTLVGREAELADLRGFLQPREGDQPDICWWLLTGPAGMGKSRLALELCLEARSRGYDAGFWPKREQFDDWDRWQPQRPTLVVVDYVASRAEQFRPGLLNLLRQRQSPGCPVRFLLLERSADPQRDAWFRDFQGPEMSPDHDLLWGAVHRYDDTRACRPLSDDDLWRIFAEVFAQRGFTARREEVLPLYRTIDAEGRPLFAAAAAEAIIAAESVERIRDWSKEDLVNAILERELARWRDTGVDEAHVNLLVYATMCQGCSSDEANRLAEQGLPVPSLDQRNDSWLHLMSGLGEHEADGRIAPLEPDVLGEWLVLERLAGRGRSTALNAQIVARGTAECVKAACRVAAATGPMVTRTINDFASHPLAVNLIALAGHSFGPVGCAVLIADTIAAFVSVEDHNSAEGLCGVLCDLITLYQDDKTIVLSAMRGRVNLAIAYADRGEPDIAIQELTKVIEAPATDPTAKAFALLNRGVAFSKQGDRTSALRDYADLIRMLDAPAELRATALLHMGFNVRQEMSGISIDCLSAVMEMPGLPAHIYSKAQFNRGTAYVLADRLEQGIADLTSVITSHASPVDQRLKAQFNRADAFWRLGDFQAALDDYSTVIDSPEAAPMHVPALMKRAELYAKLQRVSDAATDFERVAAHPDVPAVRRVGALVSSALLRPMLTRDERCRRVEEARRIAAEAGNEQLIALCEQQSVALNCNQVDGESV